MVVCLVVQGLDSRKGRLQATEMMTETPWSVFQSFRALMVNVFQDGTDQLHLRGTEAMVECVCLLGCARLGQSQGPAARRATEMMTETPWSVFQSFRALMVNVFQDGTDQLHLRGTEVECGCLLGCAGLGQSEGLRAARRATDMMIETPWSVFQSFRALMVNVFQDGTDQLHLWGTEAMVECGCLLGCAGLGQSEGWLQGEQLR